MKTKITSILLLFLTAMIWGFAFVAQADGINYVGPFTLNGVRFAVGVLALFPVVLIFEGKKLKSTNKKKLILSSILAGTVLFCASTIQQLGIVYTRSAGIAGFITGLYTILVPIGCFLIFRKRTGLNVWLGAILAVFGLFMLCFKVGEGLSFGIGELLLLIGSFFWAAHVIIIDKVSRELPSLWLSWVQFSACTILSLTAMFMLETPTVATILDAKWAILYCGVLSTGVAYTLQVVAQKRVDPTFAAIVLSTESVFSLVGGVAFGIDKISILGLFGCLVMFSGIVVSQLEFKKKKENIQDKN